MQNNQFQIFHKIDWHSPVTDVICGVKSSIQHSTVSIIPAHQAFSLFNMSSPLSIPRSFPFSFYSSSCFLPSTSFMMHHTHHKAQCRTWNLYWHIEIFDCLFQFPVSQSFGIISNRILSKSYPLPFLQWLERLFSFESNVFRLHKAPEIFQLDKKINQIFLNRWNIESRARKVCIFSDFSMGWREQNLLSKYAIWSSFIWKRVKKEKLFFNTFLRLFCISFESGKSLCGWEFFFITLLSIFKLHHWETNKGKIKNWVNRFM